MSGFKLVTFQAPNGTPAIVNPIFVSGIAPVNGSVGLTAVYTAGNPTPFQVQGTPVEVAKRIEDTLNEGN